MRWFRRKPKRPPEPLTVEQAIERGIVQLGPGDPPGVLVVDHDRREAIYYPSWRDYRAHLTAQYLGGEGHLALRDAGPKAKTPLLDLGPMSTDVDHRAAKGLAVEKGVAEVSATADYLLRAKGRRAGSHG